MTENKDLMKEIEDFIIKIENETVELCGYNLSEDKDRIDNLTLGGIKTKASNLFSHIQELRENLFKKFGIKLRKVLEV